MPGDPDLRTAAQTLLDVLRDSPNLYQVRTARALLGTELEALRAALVAEATLRTAAQAMDDGWNRFMEDDDMEAAVHAIGVLRAALAVEATEPPPAKEKPEPGRWTRLTEALAAATTPLREDFEWLVGEYERLRAAAPASEDDEQTLDDVAELLEYANRYGTPGYVPCSALSRKTARRIADRLRAAAGSPPPTPAPTRERIERVLDGVVSSHHPGVKRNVTEAMLALLSELAPPLWTGVTEESPDPGSVVFCRLDRPPGTAVEVREATDVSRSNKP